MYDYKQNVENMLTYLLYKVHIHLDYDTDVDDHKVHCMVMESNRYARNKKDKKNYNEFLVFIFKEAFFYKDESIHLFL
jgi:hypothetical protein